MAHHSSKIFLLNRYQFYRLGTTLKQHRCPRESYTRDLATSLQKWEKYIQFIHSCEFFSIYKTGTKSTFNGEIFPFGRRNVGENKDFYSNRVCFVVESWGWGKPNMVPLARLEHLGWRYPLASASWASGTPVTCQHTQLSIPSWNANHWSDISCRHRT